MVTKKNVTNRRQNILAGITLVLVIVLTLLTLHVKTGLFTGDMWKFATVIVDDDRTVIAQSIYNRSLDGVDVTQFRGAAEEESEKEIVVPASSIGFETRNASDNFLNYVEGEEIYRFRANVEDTTTFDKLTFYIISKDVKLENFKLSYANKTLKDITGSVVSEQVYDEDSSSYRGKVHIYPSLEYGVISDRIQEFVLSADPTNLETSDHDYVAVRLQNEDESYSPPIVISNYLNYLHLAN